MLSQTTRYVLSVLCYLAARGGDRVTARRIAAETATPPNYVAKILATLSRNGIVVAEKGWGGGYTLGYRATEAPLGDVLALFEDHPGPVECPFPEPICGCRVAHGRSAAGESAGLREAGYGVGVACPYGAVDCVNPVPCPLQAHWGKVRQGFAALATTRVGDLAERGVG